MDVHVSAEGLYRAPYCSSLLLSNPPHTIISVPDQTAECLERGVGAPLIDIGDQAFFARSKRAPSPRGWP